jgi:tetratricopeptide (TPR) repeat protein
MNRFRVKAYQPRYLRTATCLLAVMAALAPSMVHGQSAGRMESASLQGLVRDSHDRPVAAAKVYLQADLGATSLTAVTDSEGLYHFVALRAGVYTLRAEKAGYDTAVFGPCALGGKKTNKIDLTLNPANASAVQSASAGTPEFYDEPQFTVAGVTDTTQLGGHGSDTVLRTREGLARETVSLKPLADGSPHTSAATAAEKSLREAADHEPESFEANYRFGKLLVDEGKAREALPYLDRASQLRPLDYAASYALARAHADAGDYQDARARVRALQAVQDKAGQEKAELHHLLGDVEEKLGNSLEAVQEYQRAVELSPSEPNLFDWGAELLMHRAMEPAIEVFTKGNHVFPHSVRILVGLGVSWYARGSYEPAVQRLCEASDLNPDDPSPYLFLGKIQSVEKTQPDALAERLRRFVTLQPENSLANYYYALSLWKGRKGPEDGEALAQVQALLEKAVRLDPKLGPAYLQLGILYSERKDLPKAISAYQQTIEVNPSLEEANYRLAQAYRQSGQKLKAQEELQVYDQISKRKAADAERERHEIQQFVYTLRDRPSGLQPQ